METNIENSPSNASNAVTTSSIRAKWGAKTLVSGFVVIPSELLKKQQLLNVDSAELNVLLNLCMHWWKADDWPYPSTAKLAERMGVSQRTAQRYIEGLEKKGLIRRIYKDKNSPGNKVVTRFDMSGLLKVLKAV
jgi:Helix-turn-helix domain